MPSKTPVRGELRLALDEILVRENVRDLDDAHVDNLAPSIALRGLLVPLIVRPTDAGYELVAGHHRLAACRKLDLPDATDPGPQAPLPTTWLRWGPPLDAVKRAGDRHPATHSRRVR
jgi:hypothetical protein